ncbi:MAG TPA: hypothetical protein VKB52_04055 [Rhodanobacteraceae bacterium]|nr:hypothetical protein [Rhodanobacteraceae bacterium]
MKVLSLVVAVAVASHSAAALAAHVEDADAAKVASCTFIKEVEGKTQGAKYTRAALGNAMDAARAEAEKAGATHIVWNKVSSANVSSVSGKAYRCGS